MLIKVNRRLEGCLSKKNASFSTTQQQATKDGKVFLFLYFLSLLR